MDLGQSATRCRFDTMVSKLLATTIFCVAMAISVTVIAQERPVPGSGVSVSVPPGWSAQVDDKTLTMTAEDQSTILSFVVLPGNSLDQALVQVGKELGKIAPDARPKSKPTPATVAGFPALVVDGSGTIESAPFEIGIALINVGDNRIVMALGLAKESEAAKHKPTIEGVFSSLRKTGAPVISLPKDARKH